MKGLGGRMIGLIVVFFYFLPLLMLLLMVNMFGNLHMDMLIYG